MSSRSTVARTTNAESADVKTYTPLVKSFLSKYLSMVDLFTRHFDKGREGFDLILGSDMLYTVKHSEDRM